MFRQHERTGRVLGDEEFQKKLEKILLGHRRVAMVGGLWNPVAPRPPPVGPSWVHDPECRTAPLDEPRELTYVNIDEFEATF
jgi:hypothetical protein